MQRLEIEFKHESKKLTKSDLETIDSFFEHKRWAGQKEKALLRDLQRDKHQLREKTVSMIENQVDEARIKLQNDLKMSRLDGKKQDLHGKLTEQRREYEHRMKILDEIKRDKQKQEEREKALKE